MTWLKNNLKNNIFPLLMMVYITTSFLLPSFINAQEPVEELFPCDPGKSTKLFDDCDFNDLIKLADGITKRLFRYGLILSSIVFAYAGFLLLTSQDNPGNRSRAKNIMKNVAIGLALMICAWAIVSLIITALLDTSFLKEIPLKN